MTPSGWHDDARHREHGHDEMQLAVLRFLKDSKQDRVLLDKRGGSGEKEAFVRTDVEAEYAFVEKGRIIGFADVCEIFRAQHRVYYKAYEIKPRIDSAGGIVRQCKALRQIIWGMRGSDSFNPTTALCSVIPVVPHDDPKVTLLRELYGLSIWAWRPEEP